MRDELISYFRGEKDGALLLALLGLAAVIVAAALFPARNELRSFAITLAVFAVLELVVGVGLWARTDAQVAKLLAGIASDGPSALAVEIARMERVQRTFVVIEIVWASLIALAVPGAFLLRSRPTLWGIALGLVVQASVFLAFDMIAERRGARYLEALQHATSAGS